LNNKYKNLLIISVLAAIASILFGTFGNFIALGLGIWLINKKEINYFPLLVLICAFLSTAYILYLLMVLLCLSNITYFKIYKLSLLFKYYLLLVLFIFCFSIFKFFTTIDNFGKSINDYSFVLALAPFFYGIILTKSQLKSLNWQNLLNVMFIILLLNAIFKIIKIDFSSTRLVFFIIPLLLLLIIKNINNLKKLKIISFSLITLLVTINGLTFTLIFTALISLIFLNNRLLKSSLSIKILLLYTFFIPCYAVINYEKLDFSDYTDMKISDISNVDDLKGKVGMKLIEDRGVIWRAAWFSIANDLKIWPSIEKQKLIIQGKTNKEQDWDYHSHNLFLESLLSLGFVLGISTYSIFIYINIISFKVLNKVKKNSLESTFIILAIVSNIIGGMSGIFPFSSEFSILSIGILGISIGLNKNPNK
jgi:hypothetical protein